MLMRLLAATALFISGPTATANIEQEVVTPEAIVQVVCLGVSDKGIPYIRAGTAFRVGPTIMLSVNHVTAGPAKCFIGKAPIKVTYASPNADFSMLDGDNGPSLKIDCGGFVKDRRYVAIGYARGRPFLTTIDLTGAGVKQDGWSVLTGMLTVIPGMSGGPILDADTGKVVGTVNVENFEQGMSGSVALKDTPICAKAVA